MYLHNVADLEISFTKEEMHLGRHSEYEKKLIESLINKSKYQAEAGNYDERTRTRRNHSHSQSVIFNFSRKVSYIVFFYYLSV